ncbi:MAG: asparagine--tRNA ligase [Thaumarchaeota archaeon]|nr:asparagine--tRNA ligase [Nitrososphaerota archaeon]
MTAQRYTVEEAFRLADGSPVMLYGWIKSKSQIGGLTFAVLRDGTGQIQIAARKNVANADALAAIQQVTTESAVSVEGAVKSDARAPDGREIQVKDFKILAKSEKWPITKSAVTSPSFLYDNRHLSIRGRKSIAVMKVRAEVIYATFDFFIKRGFTLISAPTIVQSACEGGSTLFELNYFGQKAYLSQSAQLYEEAAIFSFEKVFIFQPAFRAEKSKTSKHLTEFWMIEAEQAFVSQEENLKLQEDLVNAIASRVAEKRAKELDVLGRKIIVPEPPFPKVSYDEVLDMAEKKGMGFEWGEDIPTNVEREVSQTFDRPFFITDYPLSARSFYHMTKPDNDKVTKSADLIAPEGYGEIATGGERISNYDMLMERVKKQELPAESFQWYLDLRKYGMPTHAGFGIGVERTARWLCGLKHIRAASLFPRTITRVNP